jgi:pilus assembly protein CpaF
MKRDSVIHCGDGTDIFYSELLRDIQSFISGQFSDELAGTKDTREERDLVKKRIERYLISHRATADDGTPVTEVAESVFEDMAGSSFITKYLNMPGFQELNINAWNSANVIIDDNLEVIEDTFLSSTHAVDVIKRIVTKGGGILDNSVPRVVSNISANTRIAACIYPVVPMEAGISASIRKVDKTRVIDNQSISSDEATPEIIDFLKFCAAHGASLCMSGATGSGKTTLEGFLLNYLSFDLHKRIVTIEDGSRQIDLIKYDKSGKPLNNVISFLARKSEKSEQDISQIDLLELTMKFHPDAICVDEMVSGEAYVTVETARTGHLVLSSIHSLGAENTYSKIATLAQQDSQYSYETLMRLVVEAFPIVVFMKQLDDGIRRIMEIMESESYTPEHGLKCRTLYRFDISDTKKYASGKAVVVGKHEQVRGISETLQRLLLNNGAPRSKVLEYAREV